LRLNVFERLKRERDKSGFLSVSLSGQAMRGCSYSSIYGDIPFQSRFTMDGTGVLNMDAGLMMITPTMKIRLTRLPDIHSNLPRHGFRAYGRFVVLRDGGFLFGDLIPSSGLLCRLVVCDLGRGRTTCLCSRGWRGRGEIVWRTKVCVDEASG
jgi:hypothetical protein